LKHSTNSSKATAIKKMEKSCNNATCLIKNWRKLELGLTVLQFATFICISFPEVNFQT
jgi:hypothetical protein